MGQTRQFKPLTPAAIGTAADDEADTPAILSSAPKRSFGGTFTKYCACAGVILVIVVVVILILAFTVFKIKDPTIQMNSVTLQDLDFQLGNNLSPALNMTLVVDVSVKNPNAASFKFGNSTTAIYYKARTVGEAKTPPGKAPARRTLRMNLTVDVLAERLLGAPGLAADMLAGALTVNSLTEIGGRVEIAKIVRKHVDVRMNCTITISIASRKISREDCDRHVSL